MASALKWDAESASSVVSDLNSANSEVSGKSVGAPSGCGWWPVVLSESPSVGSQEALLEV